MSGHRPRWWPIAGLVAGLVWAAATARAGQWPIPPVPANAYAVVRPNENPLVKPNSKIPVPTIVWEKVQVRRDHPRLVFTPENKPMLAKRILAHPQYKLLDNALKGGDPLAAAFMYQLTGRAAYARKAIDTLLEGKAKAAEAAYLFDWTYDAMTEAERASAIDRLWAMIAIDRASGWPRCSLFTTYPDDPRPSETPPGQWAAFYNWTYHDQDWARAHAPTFLSLIALAHHKPRAEEGVRNFWEYSLKDAALFLDHLHDGSYWQGYYWWITAKIHQMVVVFDAMRTACGIDYLDADKHPYLANVGRWLLYCSDPSRNLVLFNYGDGHRVKLDTRARLCTLASQRYARDPHVQWFLKTGFPGVSGWYGEILYGDPDVVPRAPTDLVPARAFPGTGLVVMRSSWDGNAVWASARWADWFDIHTHGDVGSFSIYCKSPLVPDTGFYAQGNYHKRHYYRRTIAHNTLTLRDPAGRGPFDDGCQRLTEARTWSWAIGQAAWLYHQDTHDRGDLLAFEHHKLYDYAAGDGTMAYTREQCKEFIRQVVFLRAGVVVVFDRVEAPRAQIEKRWLMHFTMEPRVDGRMLRSVVKGHIEDYDGGLTVARGKAGATIRAHTLLPKERRIRKLGGAIPNIPISTLCRVRRSRHRMGTGSRWQFTDPLILHYNDPLTGKKLPAIGFERDTPTDVEYEVTDKEIYLKLDAYERGRVVELRLKLEDFPNLLELVSEIGRRDVWHLTSHYLPGYEYYNQGMNYSPGYRIGAWRETREQAPELLGMPNDQGSWRIEVYPAKPAARDYFLHVLRIQGTKDDEPGSVRLNDAADQAETTIVLGGRIYRVAFAKTGAVGGRMRITDTEGKVLADRAFATQIVQKD